MRKFYCIAFLAVLLCVELFAGSLDYLENGEFAYFLDRRREGEVYYKGIAFISSSKSKNEKVFVIRSANLKTGRELIFYMYVNDEKTQLQPITIVDVDDKAFMTNETVAIANDFLDMFQFCINNQHRIKGMVDLIYTTPQLSPNLKIAADCAPYFNMFKISSLALNGGETVFEIDRQGIIRTEDDLKTFIAYDVLKGNGEANRRSEKLIRIPKAKAETKKIKGVSFKLDSHWIAEDLPGLGESYILPLGGVKQNSAVSVERAKLSKLPKKVRTEKGFLSFRVSNSKNIILSSIEMYEWNGFTRMDYDTVEDGIKNSVSILVKVKDGDLILFDLFSFADIRADNEKYYKKILESVKF